MKQSIITLLFLIAATVSNAQTPDEENFSKRLFEARLAEVALRLNLTDEQKTKFAPVYEQYCNEMNELVSRPRDGRPMMGRPNGPGMRPDGPRMRPNGPRMNPEDPDAPRGDKDKKAAPKAKADKKDKGDKKDKADRKRPERKPEMSAADKVKHMKERMEKQKKAQEIRLNYIDKFAAILTEQQLVDLYEVENDIQKKMRERVQKAHKKD